VCSVLSIEIVAFTASAAIMFVWYRNLQNFDTGVLHVAQKPCAVGACRLDAEAQKRSKGLHPGKHLFIAVSRCWKAPASKRSIISVDNSGDM
jgi:hypothetical protein